MAGIKKAGVRSKVASKVASKVGKPRRKRRIVGTPETIAVSGIGKYKKTSCHGTKTAAKAAAQTARTSGKLARLRKSSAGGYCVYTRGSARKRA